MSASKITIRLTVSWLAASAALGIASAQPQSPSSAERPSPPADPGAAKTPAPPGPTYLQRRFRLSAAEATKRASLEHEVAAATESLAAAFPDAFMTAVIDHEPNYSVTMVFSRDVPANDVQTKVPTELRPFIRVKRSRYTAVQIRERQTAIAASLKSQGLTGSISYDYRADKFSVGVGAEGDGQALMQKIPADLRSDVIPHKEYPTAIQSGVIAGDSIYGGWIMKNLNKSDICTWAFPIRITSDNSQAILSASHCSTSQSMVFYSNPAPSGHYVTMPAPTVNRFMNSGNRSYDFRAVRTTGLMSGPYVWYFNPIRNQYQRYTGPTTGYVTAEYANSNPNLNAGAINSGGGYIRVTGVVLGGTGANTNQNHAVGAVRCKFGFVTGATCGMITSSAVAVVLPTFTYQDLVRIDSPDYMVLSYHGDSGSAVTTEPLWNASVGYHDALAAGILVVGSTRANGPSPSYPDRPCIMPDDQPCPAYYMAIDRVNDFEGITILTTGGSGNP